ANGSGTTGQQTPSHGVRGEGHLGGDGEHTGARRLGNVALAVQRLRRRGYRHACPRGDVAQRHRPGRHAVAHWSPLKGYRPHALTARTSSRYTLSKGFSLGFGEPLKEEPRSLHAHHTTPRRAPRGRRS